MKVTNSKNAKWTQFNKYLYKYWKLQAFLIGLGLVATPLALLNPYLTKLIIDKAYGNRDLKLFFILAIIGGGIFIFNGLINSLSGYLSQRISRNVRFDMTNDLFKHLQSLSLSFFQNRSSGEHMYRISSDVSMVSGFICNAVPQVILLFPRLLFILAIVFYLNWRLALLASLLVPISFLHPYFFAKWLREVARRMIEKSQDIFKGLHEVFSHMHLVKAFGKEYYEIKRFKQTLSRRMDFELKNARLSNVKSFSASILNKIISGSIAFYGGYLVIKGSMTLGSFTAVMIYLTQLTGLIQSIGNFYETVIVNSVSRERLRQIFNIEPQIQDSQDSIDYRISEGRIEFQGVWFGYKEDEFILEGISFSLEPASKIGLVGPSGRGKTTLLSLILRLYDVGRGSISIDGWDIKNIKLKSLKEQIGIALQEPVLWDDTIGFNILYGGENTSKEEMVKAAKIAEADEFILDLPQQYNFLIGEMACKISEGQKQRIAIARAVIKKPKILILDEALSSLDSETEDKIIDNITREFKESTVIVVSHRLSTARKMDLIYFLESQTKMDIGRHEELMKRNPKYSQLFASQIKN